MPMVNRAIAIIKIDFNFLDLFLLNSVNIYSLPYIFKFIGNKLVTVYHSFVTFSSEIRYFVTFNGIIRVNTPLYSIALIVYQEINCPLLQQKVNLCRKKMYWFLLIRIIMTQKTTQIPHFTKEILIFCVNNNTFVSFTISL